MKLAWLLMKNLILRRILFSFIVATSLDLRITTRCGEYPKLILVRTDTDGTSTLFVFLMSYWEGTRSFRC